MSKKEMTQEAVTRIQKATVAKNGGELPKEVLRQNLKVY